MRPYKLNIFLSLIACMGLFASCTKSLNEVPLNQITDATYWNQSSDAVLFVTNLYTVLPDQNFVYYEGMSDNGISNDPNTRRFGNSTQDATISSKEWAWSPIRQAYEYFANVGKIPNMDTALRRRLDGEVYFVLAYRYFIMAALYGDIPLVTKVYIQPSESDIPVSKHAVVIDSVLQWLDNAAADLPLSYSGSDLGRITKGAALALKSRVYLFEGRWAEAVTASQAVIGLKQYSLYPDYYGFFQKDGNYSSEDILSRGYSLGNNTQNSLQSILGSQTLMNGRNILDPTSDLVNDYESKNGYYPYTKDPAFSATHPFDNRDPRLTATILYPGVIFPYPEFPDLNQYDPFNSSGDRIGGDLGSMSGYSWCKNVDHYDYLRNGANNWKSFRYGEVLLNFAEAQNEAAGPSAEVIAALDSIRARAKMPSTAATFSINGWSMDQSTLRTFIRHERRIELAGEGLRYFDILRWKAGEQVLSGAIYTIDASAGIAAISTAGGKINKWPKTLIETRYFNNPKFYVWPLPQSAIDASQGVLVQNPLWK